MQGLITLLFLVGMFISWYSQQKKKLKELERLKKKREQLKKEKQENQVISIKEEKPEDLKNRHLKGSIQYSAPDIVKNKTSLERIDRLSYIKKAIIWKEILDKP